MPNGLAALSTSFPRRHQGRPADKARRRESSLRASRLDTQFSRNDAAEMETRPWAVLSSSMSCLNVSQLLFYAYAYPSRLSSACVLEVGRVHTEASNRMCSSFTTFSLH